MARRTLRNIDDKIIKKVVKIGSVDGIDSISTIEISKSLGISEPTIFVHFQTKKQLLEEAFLFVTKKIFEGFSNRNVEVPENASFEIMWEKINSFLDLCHEFTTEIMFFYNYRHSKYYCEEKFLNDTSLYRQMIMTTFKDLLKSTAAEHQDLLISFCFDTVFSYLIQVFNGLLKDDEPTRKALFKYITTGLY